MELVRDENLPGRYEKPARTSVVYHKCKHGVSNSSLQNEIEIGRNILTTPKPHTPSHPTSTVSMLTVREVISLCCGQLAPGCWPLPNATIRTPGSEHSVAGGLKASIEGAFKGGLLRYMLHRVLGYVLFIYN